MVRKEMNKLTMMSMQKKTMTGSSIQTDAPCSVEVAEVTATGTVVIVATMLMMHKTMVKRKLRTPKATMMRRPMTMTSCIRRGVHCSAEAEAEAATADREATEEMEAMEATEAMIPKKILVVTRMVVVVEAAVGVAAVAAAEVVGEAAEVEAEVEAMASSVEMPTSLSLLKTS